MTVRALNVLENWLEDNVSKEPFTTDYAAAADALSAQKASRSRSSAGD